MQGLLAATRWLDRNIERAIMLPLYAFIALMIGGEAILRYLTSTQTQWGGTASIQAFIFLSWVGCAYHVRHRSHLRFDAIRAKLRPALRLSACVIDDVIWILIAAIVVYHSWGIVSMQQSLGAMLEGTESFPVWIATASVPAGWVLIGCRAAQDLVMLARDPAAA